MTQNPLERIEQAETSARELLAEAEKDHQLAVSAAHKEREKLLEHARHAAARESRQVRTKIQAATQRQIDSLQAVAATRRRATARLVQEGVPEAVVDFIVHRAKDAWKHQ